MSQEFLAGSCCSQAKDEVTWPVKRFEQRVWQDQCPRGLGVGGEKETQRRARGEKELGGWNHGRPHT